MTGIDTNVLVRYLTRDEADQYQRAKTFLEATFDQKASKLDGFHLL